MALQRFDFYYLVHTIGGHNTIFEISDEDTASDPQYFGYVNEQGGYIIQRRDIAGGAYRYIMGASGYAIAWSNRAGVGVSWKYWSAL